MNNNLPQNWSLVKLGDVCEFVYGKGLIKSRRNTVGEYPVYGSNGKVGFHSEYLVEGPCLIIGRKGAAGEVHLSAKNCWPIDTTYYVKNSEIYSIKYFFYLLSNARLNSLDKSTAIPGLNRNDAYKITIPLPPLPVQHKIVEKIEELFSELDSGVANLRKAKEQIKTYRQSVLAYAFSGMLTANGKRKTEIFDDPLLVRQMPKLAAEPIVEYKINNLPPGWKWVKLGEVMKVSSGKGLTAINMKGDGKYSVYGGNGINGYHSTYLFEESKLILGRVGAKCGVVHITRPKSWVTDNALVIEFKETVNIYFFYYCLSYHNLNKLSVSTAQPVISGAKIYPYEILLLPLDQQHQIVSEIERRFSVADKLEQTIDESLKKAETLKQSILKQAFEGKLIKEEKELTAFQLMQILGAIIKNLEEYNIHKGEMIIAKYLFLLQKLYKVKIGLKYEQWHFGPYTPRLKKLLNSRQGFFVHIGKGDKSYYSIRKKEQLFKYSNNSVVEINKQFPKLIELFSKYKNPSIRNHKIELLATVSKIIEDFNLIDLETIYAKMKDWKTDKQITGYSSKEEKFSKDETSRCIDFIQKNGWDKILLQEVTIC